MKHFLRAFIAGCYLLTVSIICTAQPKGDFYRINIYHCTNKAQVDSLSGYLKDGYVPQLHKAGFKNIGVFYPIANDTSADKRVVLILTLKNLNQLTAVAVNADAPKYKRLESIATVAFRDAPRLMLPALTGSAEEHVFELRNYESSTEERHIKKVKMFNEGGEIPLFKRLNFNAVFYSSVIAGPRMPNLMYLTSFDNMASREQHWKDFVASPEWKALIAMPEYANTIQKIEITLMQPAAFSDIK